KGRSDAEALQYGLLLRSFGVVLERRAAPGEEHLPACIASPTSPLRLRALPSPLVAGRDDAGVRLHVRDLVAALPDEDVEVRDVAVAVGQQRRARAIRVDGVGPRVGTVDDLAVVARREDAGHVAGAIVGLLPGPGEGLMLAGVA